MLCNAYIYDGQHKYPMRTRGVKVFIGYPDNGHGWLFYDEITKQPSVAYHAEFDEAFSVTRPYNEGDPPHDPDIGNFYYDVNCEHPVESTIEASYPADTDKDASNAQSDNVLMMNCLAATAAEANNESVKKNSSAATAAGANNESIEKNSLAAAVANANDESRAHQDDTHCESGVHPSRSLPSERVLVCLKDTPATTCQLNCKNPRRDDFVKAMCALYGETAIRLSERSGVISTKIRSGEKAGNERHGVSTEMCSGAMNQEESVYTCIDQEVMRYRRKS